MKRCPRCREEKALTEFYRNRSAPDGLQPRCKPCVRAVQAADPEPGRERARRAADRRRARRLDLAGVRADAEAECGICGRRLLGSERNVDHDHATGAVRGVLCAPCNWGLGKFEDDPDRLRAAATYIEHARSKPMVGVY